MQSALYGTVGVLGYGVDGQAVAQFLWEEARDGCRGAAPVLSGVEGLRRPRLERIVVFDDASSEFRLPDANVVIDKLTTLDNVDLLFRSPGFPLTHPLVVAAKEKGIPITSSTTHFLQHFPGVTVGVTGSNGKTTCVALITEMLKAEYGDERVERGGNDGIPRLDLLGEIAEGGSEKRVPRCFDCAQHRYKRAAVCVMPSDPAPSAEGAGLYRGTTQTAARSLGMTRFSEDPSFVVLELSSFQLIDCPASPNVSVVLNITPNHLNWHADMEEYIEAKRKITRFQVSGFRCQSSGVRDTAVLNQHDPVVRTFAEGLKSDVRWFENPPQCSVRCRTHPDTVRAAVTAARALNVSEANVVRVLETFPGVPHRIEFVRELDGVTYYNDSSSTTPESAIVACEAFPKGSVVLLLGGRDKGMDFSRLYEVIKARNVRVVPYGEMAETFGQNVPITYHLSPNTSFSGIIGNARTNARPGDNIVLSPACASFDMFKDAKERGKMFAEIVMRL